MAVNLERCSTPFLHNLLKACDEGKLGGEERARDIRAILAERQLAAEQKAAKFPPKVQRGRTFGKV